MESLHSHIEAFKCKLCSLFWLPRENDLRSSRQIKVGFLIVGVQRGGTTSLNRYLRQHPQIGTARTKEVHFFDSEEQFGAGAPNFNAYHRHFRFNPSSAIYGEATPIYLYWSDAMRRIWEYNPDMKIIALLRNPVQRAWSQWRFETARNAEHIPFSIAIRYETERSRQALPLQHRVYSYVDRGFYSDQIRRVRRFFDDRQILFIKSEQFFATPGKIVEAISKFLGLPPAAIDTSGIHNQSVGDSSMPNEDRGFLVDVFRKDIELVESLLGWDCRDWLSV
jgi:hypothetical protein